jgi:predicted lipoprotein with Yx(FWY)xxD motif
MSAMAALIKGGGLLASVVCAGAVAGCGGASSRQEPAPPQTASQAVSASSVASATRPAPPAPVTVKVASSRYGRILVDRRGRTLYLFTRDAAGRPRCYGACARAWPPYTVRGKGRAGAGARTRLIGLTRRSDGSRQLTYNGHPLYYYVGDRLPGQILCQDVEEYGGHWWIVSPAGKAVTGKAPPC